MKIIFRTFALLMIPSTLLAMQLPNPSLRIQNDAEVEIDITYSMPGGEPLPLEVAAKSTSYIENAPAIETIIVKGHGMLRQHQYIPTENQSAKIKEVLERFPHDQVRLKVTLGKGGLARTPFEVTVDSMREAKDLQQLEHSPKLGDAFRKVKKL